MNCPHADTSEGFELTWCKDCGAVRYPEASGWTLPHDRAGGRAMALAFEAWCWLAGVHVMIERGGSYSAAERVAKAETCLSSAVEWEHAHADDPKHWASDEINGGNPVP